MRIKIFHICDFRTVKTASQKRHTTNASTMANSHSIHKKTNHDDKA